MPESWSKRIGAPIMYLHKHFSRHFALTMIFIALAIRAAVPAGWMPSSERAFALTVCTGIETSTVWIDANGEIHKSDPSKQGGEHDNSEHEPCAFAGAALALHIPDNIALATPRVSFATRPGSSPSAVTIGQGLAAPPPPATGPPSLI
jgi:hypothetical protein